MNIVPPLAGMAGKLLNVAKAAADLADFPGRARRAIKPNLPGRC